MTADSNSRRFLKRLCWRWAKVQDSITAARSDLEQTCSPAEGLGREGWGFTVSCSLNAATGAPGPSGTLSHPAPTVPRPSQHTLLCLAVSWGCDTPELTWPWFQPRAHRQRTTALLYPLQETGSLPWHQGPLGSRLYQRSPEPTAFPYCSSLSSLLPFQEELLPNTLAPAFQTSQEFFPMPQFVLPFTKQSHTHMESQHPPSLDNS